MRNVARMKVGIEIVSSATNSVMRSRADAITLMPNADVSNKT